MASSQEILTVTFPGGAMRQFEFHYDFFETAVEQEVDLFSKTRYCQYSVD